MSYLRISASALTLMTSFLGQPNSWAEGSSESANVGATIVSPADVYLAVAAQGLFTSAAGVFSIGFPATPASKSWAPSGCGLLGASANAQCNQNDTVQVGIDSTIIGPQGVSLSLFREQSLGEGIVFAIVAYN